MNVWLIAAIAILWALVPCGIVCFRGDAVNRLIGLQTATVIVNLALMLLAQAFQRPSFHDLAVVMAILSFGGGLVFARFLERWL
jgi:multicomponent Na+:H+ antiporter subunit F